MEANGSLHASAAVPPEKEPRYPLNRRLGGPHSRTGFGEKDKNVLSLPSIEPRTVPPIIWSLYQLSYSDSNKNEARNNIPNIATKIKKIE